MAYWNFSPEGDILYTEKPNMRLMTGLRKRRIIIVTFIALILKIANFWEAANIQYPFLYVFALILLSLVAIFVCIKTTTYTLRTKGIELYSKAGRYDVPNPMFIPFANIQWIGPYPKQAQRNKLLKELKVASFFGSFPTLFTSGKDGWDDYGEGYLLIVKGKSLTQAVVFFPSQDFMEQFAEQRRKYCSRK